MPSFDQSGIFDGNLLSFKFRDIQYKVTASAAMLHSSHWNANVVVECGNTRSFCSEENVDVIERSCGAVKI